MRVAEALAVAALIVLPLAGGAARAQTTAPATLAAGTPPTAAPPLPTDVIPTTAAAVSSPAGNAATSSGMDTLPPASLMDLMNDGAGTGATASGAADVPTSLGTALPPEGLPVSLGQSGAAPAAASAGMDRQKALKLAGKLHPLMVHFPIALFLAAALAEFLSLFFPTRGLAASARFCLWLAAISAVVAASLGWAAGAVGYFPGQEGDLFWHRWLGTATAVVAVLTLVAGEIGRRPHRSGWLGFYRFLLVVGVVLIAVTGHFGASLVYGDGYFNLN